MTCAAFAVFAATTPAIGQSESTEDDDVFELSPFNVESADNEGYRAQNTLSGTRLKSSLGDIAASVSVFTEEFLDDIGATSIQDAYLYSVNTENEDEYAANDTEGNDVSSTNNSRVRGLVASSTTRGFFNTNFRGDTYNAERFTLARGPNSILYGIGSPAGLMNSTLKSARTNKDSFEVSYRFDSESGKRTTLDINKMLVEDKLAFRFALMDQQKESWKDPEIDDELRYYAAATYRPFKNTTISANYEKMENTRSKARGRLAKQEIEQWQKADSPYYDALNDRISYDKGATWSDTVIAPSTGLPTLLSKLREPDQHALGFDRDRGGNFEERRTSMSGQLDLAAAKFDAIDDPDIRNIYSKMGVQGLIFHDFASTVGHPDQNYPKSTFGPNDTLVPTNFNIHGLTSSTEFEGETYGIKLEQKVTENLYFEAAFNHEDYSSYFVDPIRGENAQVFVDINYYIPLWDLRDTVDANGDRAYSYKWDGRPKLDRNGKIIGNGEFEGRLLDERLRNDTNGNGIIDADDEHVMIENPNVGRYYVEGQLIGFDQQSEQDNMRFTVSYEMDFTERNKYLGKHALAFLYQKDETYTSRTKLRAFNDLDYHLGVGSSVADIGDGQNNLLNRYYVDFPGQPLTGGENSIRYPGTFETADPAFWPQVVGGYATAGDGKPVIRRNEIEGKMVVLQSRFLDNKLITTIGLRNDKETQWGDRELDPEYNLETGEWIGDPIPDDPYFSDDGDTKTFGAVYKPTNWLSLFYNKADSYQPQGQYESIFNESLDPADGIGEDYGFMLNLFESKLSARVSWYEQTATGALETDWKYNRVRNRLIQTMERSIEDWWERLTPENFGEEGLEDLTLRKEWAADLGLSYEDYKEEYTEYSDFARFTRDFESKGMEVELHARPIQNLDLVFTFGKNESKNLDSLPGAIQFVDERLPTWEKYYNLPRNPGDGDYIPNFADPSEDNEFIANDPDLPWNPNYLADPSNQNAINRNDSFGYRYLVYADGGAIIALAQEEVGTANTRARKYRGNFVANYRFTEGALNGFGIGGATRWRSKSAIGYEGKQNPINPNSTLLVPDTTKPIWGDELLDVDMWLKYQRKFEVGNKMVNWRIQLNVRNILDDADIVPVRAHTDGSIIEWEQKAPRTWMVTNTFEF